MARRAAVANSKGGVGKTTTCDSICTMAGEAGVPTLFVDLDSQCNGTEHHLGVKDVSLLDRDARTVYDVVCHPKETDLSKALIKSRFPNVWIMPGDPRLVNLQSIIGGKLGFERILDTQLARIEENFGLLVMDTGPAVSIATTLALRAATDILYIPSDNSQDSINGIRKILDVVGDLEDTGHHIKDIKIILTAQHKGGAKSNIKSKDKIKELFGDKFLDLQFPHSVKVNDAQWDDTGFVPPMTYVPKDHKLYLGYRELTEIALGAKL